MLTAALQATSDGIDLLGERERTKKTKARIVLHQRSADRLLSPAPKFQTGKKDLVRMTVIIVMVTAASMKTMHSAPKGVDYQRICFPQRALGELGDEMASYAVVNVARASNLQVRLI